MYYRDTWAEIDCDAIEENMHLIQSKTSKALIAVLKANAYGHSDYWTAKTVMKAGAIMVAVAHLDEAMALRRQGFYDEILILGHIRPSDIELALSHRFTCTVISLDWIKQVLSVTNSLEGLKFHLKIDSGMNRIGMRSYEEAHEALTLIEQHKGCIEGIFTHYSCADETNLSYCDKQYECFSSIVRKLNYPFKWIHCENSAATLNYEDELSNASRVGLIMFGVSPVKTDLPFKPALSLFSKLTCVKKISAGDKVGYGATYTAQEDCTIGTMAIGYADGFLRINQGRSVICNGKEAEIIGRVCMDQCMIKVDDTTKVGDVVEIISKNMPVERMAKECHTIPYEIFCTLSDRIPRVIYVHGKEKAIINNRLHEFY